MSEQPTLPPEDGAAPTGPFVRDVIGADRRPTPEGDRAKELGERLDPRYTKMLRAAEWLAAHGAYIGRAPIADGKAPQNRWKAKTTDEPSMVRGIVTGAYNALIIAAGRLVIPDLDKFGWHQQFLDAGLPPTFTVKTPTQGVDEATGEVFDHLHVYGLVPEDFDVLTLPGTFAGGEVRRSVKGEQSMVLGPYAKRADGIYLPLEGTPRVLATFPLAVLQLIIDNPVVKPRDTNGAPLGDMGEWVWDVTTMGSRHDHLRDKVRYWVGLGIRGQTLRSNLIDYIARHAVPETGPDGRVLDAAELERMCAGAEAKFADDPPNITVTLTERPVAGTSPFFPFRVLTDIEDIPLRPLLGGLLEPDGITAFLGDRETGKTMLACFIIVRLMDAGIRSAILDYEDNEVEWVGRIRRMYALTHDGEVLPSALAPLYLPPFDPDLGIDGRHVLDHAKVVAPVLRVANIGALFIDSSVMATPGFKQNETDAPTTMKRAAMEMMGKRGPVVMLSHISAQNRDDPSDQYGSRFWDNITRQTWSHTRTDDGFRIVSKRSSRRKDLPAYRLVLTSEGSDPPVLTSIVLVEESKAIREAAEALRLSVVSQHILDNLQAGLRRTEAELVKAIENVPPKASRSTIQRSLKSLVKQGLVEGIDVVIRGKTVPLYGLPAAPPEVAQEVAHGLFFDGDDGLPQ